MDSEDMDRGRRGWLQGFKQRRACCFVDRPAKIRGENCFYRFIVDSMHTIAGNLAFVGEEFMRCVW